MREIKVMPREFTDLGGGQIDVETIASGWKDKADAAIAQIDDAIATLEGSPTSQQVIDELVDLYQLMKKVIKGVFALSQFHELD